MKNLKLNKETAISYPEATELVRGTNFERDFNILHESTITETVSFEVAQNRRYFITKIGKKGSIVYKGSEYETKAKTGIFTLEIVFDYKHPYNFALNEYNRRIQFTINF